MGAVAGADTTKKAVRATAGDGDGASLPPVEQQQQQPAPLRAAGVADGSAAVHQSCGEDDLDDEQVERFYALLANIRALRGLYSAGDGGGAGGPASGRGRKRARDAEAPWTPAFRLEDFEEEVNQREASGGVTRRPAAAARARAAADDGREEDQATRRGNKLGRRVAARG